MRPRAIVFDAYGTLFDVRAVVLEGIFPIDPDHDTLLQLWRQRQLEYTWLLSLMDRYEDFWNVTQSALQSSCRQLHIELSASQCNALLRAYLSLPIFPEVASALESLKRYPLAILSNGSPHMLSAAVGSSGLDSRITEVISVDTAKVYKPSPRAYALGVAALGLAAEDMLFVSSNWWDVWGAKTFGYRVCWCNRSGEAMECAPDFEVTSLDQIARRLTG
ncbi:MAG: haloacid dehalogenase type II [Acidobacteriia bacterium]|nr:haloacid dehalogenase type II [Terriglobia bacterium]